MSNGQVCCALGVCCPPGGGPGGRVRGSADEGGAQASEKRVAALVDEFEHAGGTGQFPSNLVSVDWLLANFGVVTKELEYAAVEGYRQYWEQVK